MTDDQEHRTPPLDEPTEMGAISGDLGQPPRREAHDGERDEPTLPDHGAPTSDNEPAHGATGPAGTEDDPTLAEPTAPGAEAERGFGENEPTGAAGASEPTHREDGFWDEPTLIAGTDEPTLAQPAAGSDEPTIVEPGLGNEATLAQPGASGVEPTLLTGTDEPTLAEAGLGDEATVVPPVGDDEATLAVGTDEATTTGPTVGTWPFDQFEPPPAEELIWRTETPPPTAPAATRSPAYYVALGAAVVLVVALVALAAVVSVVRPRQEVAGSAVGRGGVPEITTTSAAPPPTTSTTGNAAFPELAAHPLSSSTERMPNATCELPRFDPADDQQAAFYTAAKVCADAAWRPIVTAAGLKNDVTVITLTSPAQTQTCGELEPTSPPTQCDGIVYLTPAYLRDTEQNGRYPGRYLGVFLREYARALQFSNGIDELAANSTAASGADLDTKVEQQATCLAGVAAGAMAGRGAIDSNITGEIRDRLSSVDAPAGARDWLDKGFQQRTPAACNSWTD